VLGHQRAEVVVVDDASRDATAEIVVSHYGEPVKLIRLPRNQGESGAMNAGIAAANGELIAFLDADDEWLPDKLAHQVQALEAHRTAVLVASGCRFVDGDGRLVREESGIVLLGVPAEETWRLLLARTLIAKPCVLARTAALRDVGPFDTKLAIGADQDMWIRLALAGPIEFVPEVLTIVHDTADSLTKVYADRIDRYVLPMIRRHVEQQRHRLSRDEVNAILGERYATVGRNLYFAGSLARGATLILRSALQGHEVGANLWYLLTASPPARALKRLVHQPGKRVHISSARKPAA